VDTEKSEQLVNQRMAYVSVSRAQYDVQIYTGNKSDLVKQLSRDSSHATAMQQEFKQHESKQQETTAIKIESKYEHGLERSQAHGMTR